MAIYTTYEMGATTQAEDVQDSIYDVSPVDAPIASMSETIPATARVHEWQEDALAAIKKNAHIEGSAAGTDTSTATTGLTANCQIFKETVEVSRTSNRVKKYGMGSAMAYEMYKRKLEIVRDEESAIAGDAGGDGRQTGNAGDASTPRELTSIYSQVDTSHILYATADRLTGGVAITTIPELETVLLETAKATFDDGGDPGYMITDSSTAGYFPSFALSAGRTRDIEDTTLINKVDLYVTQYGTYDVVTDRSMTNTDLAIILFDPEYSATPVLDATQDYALAKDGDRERREVVRESTYAVLNSFAHGIVDKVPTGLTMS